MDQGSNKNHYRAYNFVPTVTKFGVMWEGLSLPHDTKFGNCRCEIVDSRAFPSWSLIHGLRWSGLIKAEPVSTYSPQSQYTFHLLLGHQGLHDIHGYAWSHQPWSPRGYQWGDPDTVRHTLCKKSSPTLYHHKNILMWSTESIYWSTPWQSLGECTQSGTW